MPPCLSFLLTDTDGFEHKALSPVGDFPHGFSLDLSPSDSSGGTYMWDEEGLEALGGSGQLCGSYDSDPNSIVSQSIANEKYYTLFCSRKSAVI